MIHLNSVCFCCHTFTVSSSSDVRIFGFSTSDQTNKIFEDFILGSSVRHFSLFSQTVIKWIDRINRWWKSWSVPKVNCCWVHILVEALVFFWWVFIYLGGSWVNSPLSPPSSTFTLFQKIPNIPSVSGALPPAAELLRWSRWIEDGRMEVVERLDLISCCFASVFQVAVLLL